MSVSTPSLQYLAPPDGTFWRWSPERDAIEWIGGGTIAFRQEVREVLTAFELKGLPPLDMVVLVLAACRASWPEDAVRLADLEATLTLRVRTIAGKWHEDAVRHLQAVHRLPTELRNTLAGKAAIVETALERHSVRATGEVPRDVLELLTSAGWMQEEQAQFALLKGIGQWSIELRGLCDGLRRIDAEAVRRRMRTGLDELPRPPSAEPVEPEQPLVPSTVARLIEELKDDEQFSGLMRLARNLTAIVSLPRPVAGPDEFSLGGVSDISNRGPLDRLLLSELAHDDETLMTRIALSEALYLRREVPPPVPPRDRVLLLDSGLRMWGVPRVFAAAVGLALAADGERHGTARAFRAAGEDLGEVDLTTREGLETHLAVLDPRLHPGESIAALLCEIDPSTTETILVTCQEALADEPFRRALREQLPVCYVATVDRQGGFELWARTPQGGRLLRRARLDMSLLAERPAQPATSLIAASSESDLPIAVRQKEFPLRLPCDIPVWRNLLPLAWDATHSHQLTLGCVILTNDRRLAVWDKKGLGGRQITDRLPAGELLWWKFDDGANRLDLVIGQAPLGELHGLRIDIESRRVIWWIRFHVPSEPVLCVTEHHGLFSIRNGAADRLDFATGRVQQTVPFPPSMTWERDRFFRGPEGWSALSGDGPGARWDLLIRNQDIPPDFVLGIVHPVNAPAPLAVLTTGELRSIVPRPETRPSAEGGKGQMIVPTRETTTSAGRLQIPSGEGLAIEEVSQDGRFLLIHPWQPSADQSWSLGWGRAPNSEAWTALHRSVIELPSGISIGSRVRDFYQTIHAGHWKQMTQRTLLKRFRSVAAYRGELTLTALKGRILQLAGPTDRFPTIRLRPAESERPASREILFARDITPAGLGYTLKRADWADGSSAVLDSRGLLHLESSDRSIPAVALVLYEPRISGWSADGRRWGAEYFHEPGASLTPDLEIWNEILAPFARRLP